MAKKDVKPFLLRLDPRVHAAVQRWAEEDLRSLNGQIEYLLRQALAKRGVKLTDEEKPDETGPADNCSCLIPPRHLAAAPACMNDARTETKTYPNYRF